MTDKFVKKMIRNWLFSKGWGTNFESGELRDHGVDISVRNNKYGRFYLIETKGESKAKTTNENSFVVSLGQIITRMKGVEAGYYYGLGLPESIARIAVRRVPWQVAKKLQLRILSVDKKGRVKEFTSKDLKKEEETRRQELKKKRK
jgi:hypothetical protein